MSLGDLKPSEELMVGTVAVGAVAAIYQGFLPNIADIAAGSTPGQASANQVHGSVRQAVIASETVVAGLAILAKSPTLYVIGTTANVLLAWHYHFANAKNPVTGKLSGPSSQGQPSQNQAAGS